AELAEHVSPFAEAWRMPGLGAAPDLTTAEGLARIGREAARQSVMIGYIDSFLLFAGTALIALPLVLMVRKSAEA
ncbi:MAG: EmrB/QacA family drug resistance transporter, partial [Pseudomonadota bacterium]